MKLEYAKQELIRRYKYLYENAYLILAPYMHEQSRKEYKEMCEENLSKYNDVLIKKPLIYLNIDRLHRIVQLCEEFLLSSEPMEKSLLYKRLELKKHDKEYLDCVKKGLELVEKDNKDKDDMFKMHLGIGEILSRVYSYIEEQSGDLNNKVRKLNVIDEYYRILRYRNDGKIYTSGKNINLNDSNSIIVSLHKNIPCREKDDIGVGKNAFIIAISKASCYEENWSIFAEKEKQQIYLEYHDELPCDLEITCELDKNVLETQLCRPKDTLECGKKFILKEEEIFINPNANQRSDSYRFYQLCPHCGYIVNIPKGILSEGVKKRIEDRCSKDDKLFRKMLLYSELFALDNKSTKSQKRMLKK